MTHFNDKCKLEQEMSFLKWVISNSTASAMNRHFELPFSCKH